MKGGGRTNREREYRIDVNGGGSAGLANLAWACVSAYTLAAVIMVSAPRSSRVRVRGSWVGVGRERGGQGGGDDGRKKPFSCKERVLGMVSNGLLSSDVVLKALVEGDAYCVVFKTWAQTSRLLNEPFTAFRVRVRCVSLCLSYYTRAALRPQ